MCKQSDNAPFCDGTHARLPKDEAPATAAPALAASGNQMPTPAPTPEEPTVAAIHELARDGLSKVGHHGEMGSMGVPRATLPD